MKTLFVEIKNVYGNKTIYPVCKEAKLLAQLAGTTTFTDKTVKILCQLGYTLSPITPTLEA